MSVRYGLLALLSDHDAYGYVLRTRFEEVTGGSWPLNVGQVYTTLARLERDGLVEGAGVDGEGRVGYRLTQAGRAELAGWWAAPVERADRPRDELAIKVALAVTLPGVDPAAVLQTQRAATMRSLQDLTRLKRHGAAGSPGSSLPWRLVLESMVFAAEAEIRWLDHCETALLRAGGAAGSGSAAIDAATGMTSQSDRAPSPSVRRTASTAGSRGMAPATGSAAVEGAGR